MTRLSSSTNRNPATDSTVSMVDQVLLVWPTVIRTQDPVFPLPKSSVYAAA